MTKTLLCIWGFIRDHEEKHHRNTVYVCNICPHFSSSDYDHLPLWIIYNTAELDKDNIRLDFALLSEKAPAFQSGNTTLVSTEKGIFMLYCARKERKNIQQHEIY